MACNDKCDDDELTNVQAPIQLGDVTVGIRESGNAARDMQNDTEQARVIDVDTGEATCDKQGDTEHSQGLSDRELQRLKDQVLILVGSAAAPERLAQRRLDCGGRLFIIETGDTSQIVIEKLPSSGTPPDLWAPPANSSGTAWATRFQSAQEHRFVKVGPDVVKLLSDETLHLLDFCGKLVGVRATSDARVIRWQMSGAVVLEPSAADAGSIDVTVQDYDAMPMPYVGEQNAIVSGIILFVVFATLFTVLTAFEATASPGQVPWWRLIFWVSMVFIGDSFQAKAHSTTFVGRYPPNANFVASMSAAVVVVCAAAVGGLSDAVITLASPLPAVFMTQVTYFNTRSELPARRWHWQFAYGFVMAHLSVGVYALFYGTSLAYVGLLASGNDFVASIFLPIMTSLVEVGNVSASSWTYQYFVARQRAKRPFSMPGDQKIPLVVVWALTHGWAEGARSAAMIAGCIKSPDSYAWIWSLALSTIMNSMARIGWGNYMASYVTSRLGLGASMGTAASRAHNRCKLTCGYCRHLVLLSMVVSRLLYFQELDPEKPTFAAFSWMALIALVLLLATEIIEDILVHIRLLPDPPFKDMHEQWYTKFSNYDLAQLVTTVRVDDGKGNVSRSAARRALGRRPFTTMNLHGARPLSLHFTIGTGFVIMLVTKNLIDLLLGVGYLRGVCDHPVSNLLVGLQEALFVSTPLSCP